MEPDPREEGEQANVLGERDMHGDQDRKMEEQEPGDDERRSRRLNRARGADSSIRVETANATLKARGGRTRMPAGTPAGTTLAPSKRPSWRAKLETRPRSVEVPNRSTPFQSRTAPTKKLVRLSTRHATSMPAT